MAVKGGIIMKTNRFFMLFAAMVMTAAVSCNKEEFEGSQDVPGDVESAVVFKATSEAPLTKTAIDGEGNVTWKAGDQVVFYWQVGGQYHEGETDYPYLSNALAEDGNEVEFKIDNASETFVNAFINNQKPAEGGRNLYAVYPASSVSTYYTDADHTALDITIPTEQEGTFESASIALAKWASATPTELKFRNLCALLKVTVSDETVRKVVVRSDSEIAGKMQLNFQKDENPGEYPNVRTVLEGANEITVNVEGAGSYYVAVRPGDIENLYIELRNEAGVVVGGQTAGRTLAAERANVYALSVTAPTDKLFVKTEAAGDGSGSSWDNAMTLASLEAYMESAGAESKKVYLAAGTYVHTSAFYNMPVGFELYGGFPANASGYDLTGRDMNTNATIIDGGWDGTSTEHNKRIFVLQAGKWVFDGINFQNVRYSSKNHGSVLMVTAGTESAVLRNCSFTNCVNANTSCYGGAMRVDAGCVVNMESCTFEQNQAQLGGAIYNEGTITAVDCDFENNSAVKSGGVIYTLGDAVIKMDRCSFTTNDATGTSEANGGGAIYMKGNAKLYLNRSAFTKNTDGSNASHIFASSATNYVGISNSVIRGPFGVKTKAGFGSLLKLNGYSVIVNTTLYGRIKELGGISFGTVAENGSTIVNDIIINTNSSNGSYAFYAEDASVSVYNTIYSNCSTTGTFNCVDCLSGASCQTNFPAAETLWDEQGTAFYYADGRKYYAYTWDGTTTLGAVTYNTLDSIKTLVSGTAGMGEDFLGWLESDALKVNGVEALAVDIRGVARDTEAMWPGSYQEAAATPGTDADAGAENFNVK